MSSRGELPKTNFIDRGEKFTEREKCPVCGSRDGNVICDVPFTEPPIRDYLINFYRPQGDVEFDYLVGGRFILVDCVICGLIYQKQVLSDSLMKKLYEEWINPEINYEIKQKKRDPAYFQSLARDLGNVLAIFDMPPFFIRCLDFGMGWGNFCRIAIGFGCQVFGTELSEVKINHAKNLGVTVLDYEELGKNKFEYIHTEQVFEHLINPMETLMDLRNSMEKGGIIKLSVPNGWDIRSRLVKWDWKAEKGTRNSLNPVAPLEHINCFNEGALLFMARQAGLKRIEIADTWCPQPHKPWKLRIRDKVFEIFRPLNRTTYIAGSTSLYFTQI